MYRYCCFVCATVAAAFALCSCDGTLAPGPGGSFGRHRGPLFPGMELGRGGNSIAQGDLDGDGDLDLATALHAVSVFLNNGDGTFAAPAIYDAGNGPDFLKAGDLDGDLDLDLVVANMALGGKGISVLLNNGDGTFAAPVTFDIAYTPRSLALTRSPTPLTQRRRAATS